MAGKIQLWGGNFYIHKISNLDSSTVFEMEVSGPSPPLRQKQVTITQDCVIGEYQEQKYEMTPLPADVR